MKSLVLLLAIGLSSSEKLDRTYLPPPGSKYSGGSPGAIDVPLEFPKETYSTTLRPQPGQSYTGIAPGDARLTVGIDRGTGLPNNPPGTFQNFDANTPGPNYYEDSSKLPTTTTSYVFTQTTSYPTPEGFETTASPIGPSGFPIDNLQQTGFGNFPQGANIGQQLGNQIPGFGQPGVQITGQQHGLAQAPGANISRPGSVYQIPGSGGQIFDGRQPQSQSQYQQGLRPSSTVSPISGSSFQPGFTQQSLGQGPSQFINEQGSFSSTIRPQGIPQGTSPSFNVPQQSGDQRFIQPGGSKVVFPSSATPSIYLPGSSQYGDNVRNIPQQGSNIPQQQQDGQSGYPVGPQGTFPSSVPSGIPSSSQPGSSQYRPGLGNIQSTVAPGTNILQPSGGPGQFVSQQGVFPSTVSPQGISIYQPGITGPQYGVTNQPGSVISQAGSLPGQRPGQLTSQQGIFPSTVSPQGITNYQPGITGTQYGVTNQPGSVISQAGSLPGQRPSQFTGQQGIFPSTVPPQGITNYQPGTTGPQYGGINQPGSVISQAGSLPGQRPGQQGVFPSTVSPQGISNYQPGTANTQFDSNLQPGSVISQAGSLPGQRPGQFIGQQGVFPSTLSPQNIPNYQPGSTGTQFGTNLQPGTVTPGSVISQSGTLPGQQIQTSQIGGNTPVNQPSGQNQYQLTDGRGPQHFSTTARPGLASGDSLGIYGPISSTTASSTTLPPGYSNQPFPSTIPTNFPSYGTTPAGQIYSTPDYPESSAQGNIPQSRFPQRPERPQADSDRNAVILNYENVLTPEGFAYSFDTSNGIHADENGTATDGVKAQGSYSYTGDDGKVYSVVYSADENGFQPRGDHLPTPPPVPEAIQRVIDQAVKEKEAGISHDGSYDEAKYGHTKYQGPMNRYRPHFQDRTVTNAADVPDDESTFDDARNRKPGSLSGGRRPVTNTDDITDEYEEDINENKQQPGGVREGGSKRKPTNRIPSKRPPSEQSKQDEYDDSTYDEEGNIVQTNQPTGTKTDRVHYSPGMKDSTRRRPIAPGRKPNLPGSSSNTRPEDEYNNEGILEETDDLDRDDEKMFKKYNRPMTPNRKPTKTPENKYQDQDYEYEDVQGLPGKLESNQQTVIGQHKGSKRPGYSGTSYSEASDNGVPNVSIDRNQRPLKHNGSPGASTSSSYIESQDYSDGSLQKPGRPGVVEQSVSGRPKGPKRPGLSNTDSAKSQGNRPRLPGVQNPQLTNDYNRDEFPGDKQGVRQQSGTINNVHPSQQPDMPGTGYQYIPPQSKFGQGEISRIPSRVTGQGMRRPFDRHQTPGKETTIQPFITPNASREDETVYEENVEPSFPSRKPGSASGSRVTSRPDEYESDSDEEKSDQGSKYYPDDSDQDIGDEEITSTKVRPGKPGTTRIGSTRRPVYGQPQQTTGRPRYDERYTSRGQDRITQKRPMQGQFDDKQYPTEGRPEQEYSGKEISSSQQPGYDFVSSTTASPSRAPMRFETHPEDSYRQTTQSQYPTTYEPMDEHQDRLGGSVNRPVGSRIPSYRPTYSESTQAPGSATTRPGSRGPFDRPSSRPSDYSDDGTTAFEPSMITKDFSRVPSSRPTSGPVINYDRTTSSTSRPSISDVPSGPPSDYNRTIYPGSTSVRPGSRLPGRPGVNQIQNIPSTTYRPNYTFTDGIIQPGATVDGFGRPIGPGQVGSTTYRPEYSVTSTGLPSGTYQEGVRSQSPGSKGQVDFGSPQYPYRGQQPGQFSQGEGQGTEGPYRGQTSTERIIGEDFSGPKQPQRFDPQTGYHY